MVKVNCFGFLLNVTVGFECDDSEFDGGCRGDVFGIRLFFNKFV